ncbi:MAG: DUF1513 domain-containing protein [Chromatiales bacterium]|nr:DUF1513 domain-containing protein [Chromatiales bacterium]MDX9766421.1 DUF1513 domain-containing protein [Ectothiorhodospiraceae bacterium]
MTNRRRFLANVLGLGALGLLASPFAAATQTAPNPRRFMSARADAQGRFFATVFDDEGRVYADVRMPTRGHGSAVAPSGREAVMFSRRPGDFLLVIDPADGRLLTRVTAAPGRFFDGHGCFVAGRLYVTETLAETGDGLIGVYDPQDAYRRIGEFSSGGLDPHDIRVVGERTLVVANGGILTHPDAPRVKLNLDTMDPSLAYLDAVDGSLVAQLRLPPSMHQSSIRHLAVARDGTVAVAMQYEGPSTARVPLVALHRPGTMRLETLALPEPLLVSLRNYCGSAAVDATGRVLGVSSPRGGLMLFWDVQDGRLLGSTELRDGCGIAAAGDEGTFLLTSGLGGVHRHHAGDAGMSAIDRSLFTDSRWDNHLLTL